MRTKPPLIELTEQTMTDANKSKGPDKPRPRSKRLSLHPLTPQEALRHALTAGKVEKPKKLGK